MKKQKRIVPNVIRGGVAIPLGANYFLMKGKTHEQGGIDIGKDLEVENGELMKIDKNNMTIVSNAPIMNGISPAEYALGGLKDGTFTDRFKEGFKYQEKYKDVNGLKDDGTKAKFGKDFKMPKLYLRREDVFDEIDDIIYNNNNPKELSKLLDEYWNSIENNVSIPAEFKQNIKQDIEHYKKYPYASSLITRNRIDDNKKYENDKKLRIPADYNKMITLSKAGKSTGITVTKNMLDSLAYRGGRAQADTVRVLGVPAQETGLGKFEGTTYMTPRQIIQDDEYYKLDRSENPSYFIREGGVNPTELMNNHYYYASSADQEALGAIFRKTGAGHDTSNGNVMANIGYNEITPEVEEEAKKTWRYTTNKRAKENLDVHPLEQAYELDKTGNYNLGISNHNALVQKRGEELWNSPEIQQWWKESGKQWYNKGKAETKKLGGKADMKQNKRNVPSTGEKKKAELGKRTDYLDLLIPGGATKAVSKISSKLPDKIISNVETPKLKSVSEAFVEPTDDRKSLTPQQKEELISGIIEGGAALTSAGMLAATTASNNKMLNNLQRYQDPTKPILSTRQRLKTSVNVNPQLTKSKRILDKTNKFVLNNTGSSQSAYNRIRQNNFDYIDRINDIYSQKENTETGLINQDRTADNENVRYNNGLINQYLNRKDQIGLANTELDNTIAEKKAENKAALYQGIGDIVTNMVTNYGKRKQNNKNLRVMAAGFPSITPEYLNEILYR